jgi:putative hemolysin
MIFWEIGVVLLLILLNGFFAMSELAIVSAKRPRLQQMAAAGRRGAAAALRLSEDPTGFLSTVQVGITLVGVIAGAYSGAAFAEPLGAVIGRVPPLAEAADEIAFAVVVVAITYASLIVGELVPKRIALNRAETIATIVAPIMSVVAAAGAPVVWFLRVSTEAVLRLLGVRRSNDAAVTEEDVKAIIAEGAETGVIEPVERDMIEGVLRLADRPVRSIMTPRPDTMWLSTEDDAETILTEIRESGRSRFPVSRGDVDDVVGIVQAKDLLEQMRATGRIDVESALREPLYVNESMPVLKLLAMFRASPVHMALVIDEYGSLQGIVTPTDILEAIAGSLPEGGPEEEPEAVQRTDGSWLLDASMSVDDVERAIGAELDHGDYATLAGFVLDKLGHLPGAGESLDWKGWTYEVVDLDGRRIDKVLARPTPE